MSLSYGNAQDTFSFEEYQQGERQRIQPQELQPGEEYIARWIIKPRPANEAIPPAEQITYAADYLTRVVSLELYEPRRLHRTSIPDVRRFDLVTAAVCYLDVEGDEGLELQTALGEEEARVMDSNGLIYSRGTTTWRQRHHVKLGYFTGSDEDGGSHVRDTRSALNLGLDPAGLLRIPALKGVH